MGMRMRSSDNWMDSAPPKVVNLVVIGFLIALAVGGALGAAISVGEGFHWIVTVVAFIVFAFVVGSFYASIINATVGVKYRRKSGGQP